MRFLIATGLAIILASSAHAQVQPAATMFDLKVTEAQLNVIGKALGKLPMEEVIETRDAVLMQVTTQIKAREEAANKARQDEVAKAVAEKLRIEAGRAKAEDKPK